MGVEVVRRLGGCYFPPITVVIPIPTQTTSGQNNIHESKVSASVPLLSSRLKPEGVGAKLENLRMENTKCR